MLRNNFMNFTGLIVTLPQYSNLFYYAAVNFKLENSVRFQYRKNIFQSTSQSINKFISVLQLGRVFYMVSNSKVLSLKSICMYLN